MKWGVIIVVVAVLTGMAIHTFVPRENKELTGVKPDKVKSNKMLNVTARVIRPDTLIDGLTVSGRLLPDEEVDLSFETSGKITSINFSEGTWVRKGQLLAKVNDAPLRAELHKLEAQLKLANNRVYRQNVLLEKEAVSQEALEQVKTDLATLKAEIEMVKAEIEQTELKAPFDGIIGLRKVSVGSYASPTTVIATLTNIKPLKIEFSVPERYTGIIQNGNRLSFSVEGNLKPFSAKVYATESKVDLATHTFTVRALYPNADGKLYPGRFASITLVSREIPNALAVPSEAIVSEMGIDKVFLYKNGYAEPVEIVKGLRNESDVQVLRGLTAGDTVITSGTMQLRTGQKITLDEVK